MKLKSGSLVVIPLLKDFGYAWAKYIDLSKLKKGVIFPDLIKVYNLRSDHELRVHDIDILGYLLSPIAIAGLRDTIRVGAWKVVGESAIHPEDILLPSFKGGNSSYDEIVRGDWFLHKDCQVNNPVKVPYEEVKYLQPFSALSSQNVELRLTMYHIIKEGLNVKEFFDLNDDRNKWNYKQVLDSPSLLSS